MVAKLIVWGKDRHEAIRRMARSLSDFEITGVPTTIGFQEALLKNEKFLSGNFTTSLILEDWPKFLAEMENNCLLSPEISAVLTATTALDEGRNIPEFTLGPAATLDAEFANRVHSLELGNLLWNGLSKSAKANTWSVCQHAFLMTCHLKHPLPVNRSHCAGKKQLERILSSKPCPRLYLQQPIPLRTANVERKIDEGKVSIDLEFATSSGQALSAQVNRYVFGQEHGKRPLLPRAQLFVHQ